MQFTIAQIDQAKITSNFNFPKLIQEFKNIGVDNFITLVEDGHTNYFDAEKNEISSDGAQDFVVSDYVNKELFLDRLKLHQLGKTNFSVFCSDCAKNGVDNWIVNIPKMTCTYYDKAGNEVLKEEIPSL